MVKIKFSLADQLEAFANGVPAMVREELEKERKQILTEIAEDLEDRFVHDVFGQQRTPEGQPWVKISELTKKVREGTGQRASDKLGIGPQNKMIRSFQLGDANNHFRISRWKLEFGSKLRKKGHSVVETFQKTYQIPRGNSPEKRRRVRSWMAAVTGVPAPGEDRHLAHPGRKVVSLPAAWQKGHIEILKAGVRRALVRATKRAAQIAAGRVAGTAPGALPRRISEVG